MSDHLIAEANRHAKALPTTNPTHADIAWYVREVYELRADAEESKARERAAIASWDEERQRALREGGRVVELRAECNNLRADLDAIKAIRDEETAHAERAEAELHALRLVCGTTDADKFSTWVDRANARAEEAEHDCRVLIVQLNVAKDELATEREKSERYRLASLKLDAELAAERARLDWLELRGPWESWNGFGETGITLRENIRAAIDAAMKEGA